MEETEQRSKTKHRVKDESRFGATINRGSEAPVETKKVMKRSSGHGFLLHLELDFRGDAAGRAKIVGKDGRGACLVGELDKAERRCLGDLAHRAVNLQINARKMHVLDTRMEN
jgi:hypothetical protein